MVANFQNLFSVNAANTANNSHYALIDSRGRLVVDEEVYNAYHSFESSNLPKNAYEFALYMLYGDNNGHLGSNNWSDFISAAQEVFLDKYEDDKTLAKGKEIVKTKSIKSNSVCTCNSGYTVVRTRRRTSCKQYKIY